MMRVGSKILFLLALWRSIELAYAQAAPRTHQTPMRPSPLNNSAPPDLESLSKKVFCTESKLLPLVDVLISKKKSASTVIERNTTNRKSKATEQALAKKTLPNEISNFQKTFFEYTRANAIVKKINVADEPSPPNIEFESGPLRFKIERATESRSANNTRVVASTRGTLRLIPAYHLSIVQSKDRSYFPGPLCTFYPTQQ